MRAPWCIHALALGAVLALLFTVLAWTALPLFYGLLGGEGRSLANALTYSHVLFTGALVIWANFFLSALLRGGGDAATPGRYMLFSSIAQIPLSYVLALGIGDWPGLGMAGPAISSLLTSAGLRHPAGARPVARQAGLRADRRRRRPAGTAVLGHPAGRPDRLLLGLHRQPHRHAGDGPGRPLRRRGAGGLRHRRAAGIHAGAAGLRHRLGADDPGRRRGRRQRLEARGARCLDRQPDGGRARSASAAGSSPWCPRAGPAFSPTIARVVEATVAYITRVAPFYCLFGLGMTLSFASQGAGRMKAPFVAGIARLIIATVGGWFAVEILGWGLPGVFVAIAVGMIAFGSLIAGPLLVIPWGARRVKLAPAMGASDAAALDDRDLEPQPR